MEQFFILCPLAKYTTGKEMFKKVDTLDIGEKENTGEMGEEHSGRLFLLNIHWFMRKGSGESDSRNATGALLKEQNHNFAKRFIDSKGFAKYS